MRKSAKFKSETRTGAGGEPIGICSAPISIYVHTYMYPFDEIFLARSSRRRGRRLRSECSFCIDAPSRRESNLILSSSNARRAPILRWANTQTTVFFFLPSCARKTHKGNGKSRCARVSEMGRANFFPFTFGGKGAIFGSLQEQIGWRACVCGIGIQNVSI